MEREREREKKRDKKKERYTHILLKQKKLNTWKNMCIYIYIIDIYTCREVYCKCAKLDLIKKRERGLGGGRSASPQSRMTIPVFTGNAVV